MKTRRRGPVCLIGNLCVDVVIRGLSRLPAWGREVAGTDYRVAASGQTTYTALALRALGIQVSVIGRVGDDAWGDMILSTLRGSDIDVSGVERSSYGPTALTVAAVRMDGERAFVSEYGCLKAEGDGLIDRHFELAESSAAVGLLGSFSFPGMSLAHAAARIAPLRENGALTFLDTGWDPAGFPTPTVDELLSCLPAFALFLPNWEEARACSGGLPFEAAAELFQKRSAGEVIVKLGPGGCYHLEGTKTRRQPSFPVDAVDSVGAGDVFNAAFLYARLNQFKTAEALTFASGAAALRVGGKASFSSPHEVTDFLAARSSR